MESQRPWLSVLVPVYEVEQYVEETAASVLSQADEGVEIVFMNDGSRDGSARVVEELRRRHPDRIRVLSHEKNQGLSATRNDLISAARGEYMWFVDADDLMEPGAMSALKAIVDRHHPDLVMCDFKNFDDGPARLRLGRSYRHLPTFAGASDVLGEDRDALVRGLFTYGEFHAWSKIVRRTAWPDTLRYPVGRRFEDTTVSPRLALAMQTHYHVPRVWMRYRQRPTSMLAAMTPTQLDDWLTALVGYMDAAKQAGVTFSDETIFRIASFCGRSYVDIAKRSRRVEKDIRHLRRYVELLHRISPLDDGALSKAYLRRGWLATLWEFRYWLRRAR